MIAALVVVFLSGNGARAAEPVTARAGAARKDLGKKPSGPTPMVKRGLILPPRMLDVYVQPAIERPVGANSLRLAPTVGALWGIIPELHADFQITPFYLPERVAGPGRIAVVGRFYKTQPVDLGVSFTSLFDPSTPHFISYVQPGVGAIFRPNALLRVDAGVQLPLYTTADFHLGCRVPVTIFFQLGDRVHFGSTSALIIADLRSPQKTTSIPFGLTMGYSAGPELDFAAFTPYVSWTNFYTPGTGNVDTRSFVVGVIADIAFELP